MSKLGSWFKRFHLVFQGDWFVNEKGKRVRYYRGNFLFAETEVVMITLTPSHIEIIIICRFFSEERGKPESPSGGKTSQSREENQQSQPTYDAESGNQTRATLVGSECSHHWATTALPNDRNCILTGYGIFVTEKFLVFHR